MALATICHADAQSSDGQTQDKPNPADHAKLCAACLACHAASAFTVSDAIAVAAPSSAGTVALVARHDGASAASPWRSRRIRGPPGAGMSA
jgi:hypothetical protein